MTSRTVRLRVTAGQASRARPGDAWAVLLLGVALLSPAAAAPRTRRAVAPARPAVAPPPVALLSEEAGDSFDLSTSVRVKGAGEGRVVFHHRSAAECDYLRVTGAGLTLVRVERGKPRALAAPCKLMAPLGAEPVPLVVKRRPMRVSVVCRGVMLLSVGDLAPKSTRVGVASVGGIQLDAPALQPTEPPLFSDDFMRRPEEPSPWERLAGEWRVEAVGEALKSANAFSYRGRGEPALSLTGHPFWDDCRVECSVKALRDQGTAGVCLYAQDGRNYLAATWGSVEGLRLLHVRDGKPTVLAERPIAWLPGQWYRLGVQARDGDLAALVDGHVCLEARDPSFGRGKVGLLVDGGEWVFDDFAVDPAVTLHLAQPAAAPGRWLATGGAFVAGSSDWSDYEYRARIALQPGEETALLFGWEAPGSYSLLRLGAGLPTRLCAVSGGQERVLAETAQGCRAGQAAEVSVDFRPAYACARIDGRKVVESASLPARRGAVGLGALSPSVQDVTVRVRDAVPPPEEAAHAEFSRAGAHPDMAEWANAAAIWDMGVSPDGQCVFRHKGEFFGDTCVRTVLPKAARAYRISLSLAADAADARDAYVLNADRDGARVRLELLRKGLSVATGEAEVDPAEGTALSFASMGDCVTADLEEKRVLAFADAAPLRGRRVAFRTSGVVLDVRQVQVSSRNTLDDTFRQAPVDWLVQAGTWEVTNRWSCDPTWSFFGGRDSRLAMAWHKARFPGDMVLQYFAAPRMLSATEDPEAFRDLNATICGDRTGPHRGYSFIVGGKGRWKAAILRNGAPVAENASFILVPPKEGHHQWFDVRAARHGRRISLTIDGQPVVHCDDPSPLAGDRVGLWTQDNGMMVARAIVSCEHPGEKLLAVRPAGPPEPTPPLPAPLSLPLANDFEASLGQWRAGSAALTLDGSTTAEGKSSLCLTNTASGGDFDAAAVPVGFEAAETCKVAFDYRVPPGVFVDLYVRVGPSLYAVGFTGRGRADPARGVVASLGRFEGIRADGTWQRAHFDLGAALRRVVPGQGPVRVSEVLFAAWDPGDPYAAAGVTGNIRGARYHIDRFTIQP